MDISSCIFPFGQPLQKVEQTDRTPKKGFVLGVYVSAVHARWVDAGGKEVVKAFAVASEPYIFWRGENAEEIIRQIHVPEAAGRLGAADQRLNGPSGIALDQLFLKPLGLKRQDAWLCDLVPYSCKNKRQEGAIARYVRVAKQHGLPMPSIPPVPTQLADDSRRQEILSELEQSKAEVLILLGDKPIEWFLKPFDPNWKRLSDFQPYGQLHDCKINGRQMKVLPVAHPRQVAKLGMSDRAWFDRHQEWMKESAATARK